MAEFCSCGSLMIDGNCTNKNCSNRAAGKQVKQASVKKTSGGARETGAGKQKTEKPVSRSRRASKCITYNLYDIKPKE